MLGKTLVFLNHTPYESFWGPLTAEFAGYPYQVLDLNDHWERTGNFDVFSSLDAEEVSPLFIAHGQGAYFLLNARLKNRTQAFQACLIEPDDFCFSEALLQRLQFLRSMEKMEFVDSLREFYTKAALPSHGLEKLLASFDGQENFMKAQIAEIAGMIEERGPELIRVLRDGQFLVFYADYGHSSQKLSEIMQTQPFSRLHQSQSIILKDSDYLPFFGAGLEPILGNLVDYLSA